MRARQHLAFFIIAALNLIALGGVALGAFTTVINSPPDMLFDLGGLKSNTQVNLYEGTTIKTSSTFAGYWGPTSNIELNLYGADLSSGLHVGNFSIANTDIVVNVHDNSLIHRLASFQGSTINLYGGEVGTFSSIGDNSFANLHGGTIGRRFAVGGKLNVYGGDFQLNGVALPEPPSAGNSLDLDLTAGQLLSGVLTDGTPFAFTLEGTYGDFLWPGTLTLHATDIPAAMTSAFVVPNDAAPRGLRSGQQLQLSAAGTLGNNFTALPGSTMTIAGGNIGESFEAVGATINMSGGTIGGLGQIVGGTTMNLSGGKLGSNFAVGAGSTLNMTGGTTGWLFEANAGSHVRLAGGAQNTIFAAQPESNVTLVGGEFRLNDRPVSGLDAVGSAQSIEVPPGAVLSGVYPDGRPFAFSTSDSDTFSPGTLHLEVAALPRASATVFRVPNDPEPIGLRSGQVLQLSEGGQIGDNFQAAWGSVAQISGGIVGPDFEAVGALVNISGGAIGGGFEAFYGSVINISGGEFAGAPKAHRGSVINISGGAFGAYLNVYDGGVINMSAGVTRGYASVTEGSVLNFSGGDLGEGLGVYGTFNMTGGFLGEECALGEGGVFNLSGGIVGDRLRGSGILRLRGGEFRLNGAPVEFEYLGQQRAFDFPAGSTVTGTLADGTPFTFSSDDGDNLSFGEKSLRLQTTELPHIGPAHITVSGATNLQGLRAGQALVVQPDGIIPDNFNAGRGSTIQINGGELGANFEATGAQVTITAGLIGNGFDAFDECVVNIAGGSFGYDFTAHSGSIVNIAGGRLAGLTLESGAVVNLSGGYVADDIDAELDSRLHLFVSAITDQSWPGWGELPLPPTFGPGQTIEFSDRGGYFRGTLADGSPFSFRWQPPRENDPLHSTRTGVLAITWVVPEPSALTIFAALITVSACIQNSCQVKNSQRLKNFFVNPHL